MGKDLTNSSIERQNVLNNPYALQEIQKAVDVQCIPFEDRMWLTKEQVASFFEVTPRTIDNYISKYEEELRHNGYEVILGNRLKNLKIAIREQFGDEMNFITKTTVLGIFDFRAFLNIAMLIAESERARLMRQAILDIVIDTINQCTGGGTKYINQALHEMVVDGIKYEKIEGQVYEMRLFEEEEIETYLNRLYEVRSKEKTPYDFVEIDSDSTVEKEVAENDEKLYLVRETKSTHDRDKRRETENRKIDCGRAHFDALGVNFEVATNIHEVLAK